MCVVGVSGTLCCPYLQQRSKSWAAASYRPERGVCRTDISVARTSQNRWWFLVSRPDHCHSLSYLLMWVMVQACALG